MCDISCILQHLPLWKKTFYLSLMTSILSIFCEEMICWLFYLPFWVMHLRRLHRRAKLTLQHYAVTVKHTTCCFYITCGNISAIVYLPFVVFVQCSAENKRLPSSIFVISAAIPYMPTLFWYSTVLMLTIIDHYIICTCCLCHCSCFCTPSDTCYFAFCPVFFWKERKTTCTWYAFYLLRLPRMRIVFTWYIIISSLNILICLCQ